MSDDVDSATESSWVPSRAAQRSRGVESHWTIAVLPGDGIGTEVMAEALKVLAAVSRRLPEVRFDFQEESVGAAAFFRGGDPLPDAALRACRKADAVLLGAMGLPNVRWPDGRELTPQIDLREQLDLYAGIRPLKLYHAQDTRGAALIYGAVERVLANPGNRTPDMDGRCSTQQMGDLVVNNML